MENFSIGMLGREYVTIILLAPGGAYSFTLLTTSGIANGNRSILRKYCLLRAICTDFLCFRKQNHRGCLQT